MTHRHSNIVLIGMPGSGKSTVGIILAKLTSRDFLDTDILIQTTTGRTLQQIVDGDGHMALRRIEEDVLLSVSPKNQVISTGGSAPYSHAAMAHLQKDGIVVFLHADLKTLRRRIDNFETRGLAKKPEQSFEDLFEERLDLYSEYADITIEGGALTQEQVCRAIIAKLAAHHTKAHT
ncbi:MAG: shikimate kinase [Desulfopila sp.]